MRRNKYASIDVTFNNKYRNHQASEYKKYIIVLIRLSGNNVHNYNLIKIQIKPCEKLKFEYLFYELTFY